MPDGTAVPAAATPSASSSAPTAPTTTGRGSTTKSWAHLRRRTKLINEGNSRRCNEAKSPKEQIQFVGKYLVRAVNPYLDVGLVMTYGAARNWNPPSAPDPSNTIVIPQSELDLQAKHADAFDAMLASAPGCLEVVKEFYHDPDRTHWSSLVSLVRTSTRSARQQDSNDLKHNTHYVLPDPNTETLTPPISRGASESDRGITHPVLRNYILSWTL
ncbi:hypothetical protein C8F04DRAFT_605817 [Mycena alexandri]|uniref:Uncharacterized protein n=1 Tax=Mycena alexandri TaxID=1745969 RepID=A0AAD6SUJ3_9AGAR|nr:hypothetical protein C8F04DRAFT_605817 [Mycena alexandri]